MSSAGLIPQGYYDAAVTGLADEEGNVVRFQWGKAKTGTVQCLVYFRILEGPYAGRTVPWFAYVTKDNAKRVMQSFRYCGLKGNDAYKAEEQAMDQVVSITVEHNTNPDDPEARTYARVAWVNQAGGGRAMKLNDPLSKDQLLRFSGQLKNILGSVKEVDAPRAAAPGVGGKQAEEPGNDGGWGQAQTACADDDDIPF